MPRSATSPSPTAAELGVQLSPGRIADMRRQGLWGDAMLTDFLDRAVAARPDAEAITSVGLRSNRVSRLTYRDVVAATERVAAGLAGLGARPGTVVSVQLPSWWQFSIVVLACTRLGCIVNPVMPTARGRDLQTMLGLCETSIHIVPRHFRGVDYPSLIDGFRKELPRLEHVVVIDDEAADSFSGLPGEIRRPSPFSGADAVTEIMFTSGTTGLPKGVMHTSNTLLAATRAFAARNELGAEDVIFMGSPLAHQTGYVWGIFLPILLGCRVVLLDQWDPRRAAELIEKEGVTFSVSAPTFLADLLAVHEETGFDAKSLKAFVLAGAPVPKILVERARERLGIRIGSAWGMTEVGLPTISLTTDSATRVSASDGLPVPGVEIRIVDPAGLPAAPGIEGRLQARGAFNFVGYLKQPALYDTDGDGWFDTGDLGFMDEQGYLRITGRAKDIIIRGGEKIPVADVENVLYRHPAIEDVAIVAMPDDRLGERACAYVTLKSGADSFDMDDLKKYLSDQGVTRTYFPERLEIIPQMPRTPSGKIQKFELRRQAANPAPR